MWRNAQSDANLTDENSEDMNQHYSDFCSFILEFANKISQYWIWKGRDIHKDYPF